MWFRVEDVVTCGAFVWMWSPMMVASHPLSAFLVLPGSHLVLAGSHVVPVTARRWLSGRCTRQARWA